jgi:hypothetical protein
MNQKGEVTILSCMAIVALSGLMILCSLELQKNYRLMEKRSQLFLCTKEAKGELGLYMKFMGRTNWGIKNARRAALIALFIPGLQGAASEAEKVRKVLITVQNLRLISYLKTLTSMRQKGCSLDPRMFITPFELSASGYLRHTNGAAKLRNAQWSYQFLSMPYLLSLEVDSSGFESVTPKIKITVSEKLGKFSSLLSSR